MSLYTRLLSLLGEKEANKIDMDCKERTREYEDTISLLRAEKTYLLGIIAKNVEDIAGIKRELEKVNEKLAEVLDQNKKQGDQIQFIEVQNNDLTFIIEAFLEKYPDAKLSEMVRKKNKNENP